MRELVTEILLRLSKVVAASIIGALVYVLLTGPFGATGSVELGVLAWLVGAAVMILMESSPL